MPQSGAICTRVWLPPERAVCTGCLPFTTTDTDTRRRSIINAGSSSSVVCRVGKVNNNGTEHEFQCERWEVACNDGARVEEERNEVSESRVMLATVLWFTGYSLLSESRVTSFYLCLGRVT